MSAGALPALAFWLDRNTIAWPETLGSPWDAAFTLVGHPHVRLLPGRLSNSLTETHRRVKEGYFSLQVTGPDEEPLPRNEIARILRGPVEIRAFHQGVPAAHVGVQLPGVIDDLYEDAAKEQLGLIWESGRPYLRLWAPTAESVRLRIWASSAGTPEVLEATRQDTTGIWTVTGEPAWEGREYLWEVDVYVPSLGRVALNLVTDPYSVGLTEDSVRSVLVDLASPEWAPPNWGENRPAPLRNQCEQTIYELHVRDFSAWDDTVSESARGTYKAFTNFRSAGMGHLRRLAEAGLTTVHLLPTFDIATRTIPERSSEQRVPQVDGIDLLPRNEARLRQKPDWGPASELPRQAVRDVANTDAYNWGYDPLHWMTPEGSYATEANRVGGRRTREYREMVAALHQLDLRVVQDVVFNHTDASGQAPGSVLDRIVPGYYHRLNASGDIEKSTCCENVATEHLMAEKLMVDTLVTQAVYYHVDGFRFDLMGHHTKENLLRARHALDSLTTDIHGIDGKEIYLYGEGWDFGEVEGGARFHQASLGNLNGTETSVFNDRLRDAVRGGGPGDYDPQLNQGIATGLFWLPNEAAGAVHSKLAQRSGATERTDWIRLGLVGSLRNYPLYSPGGQRRTGEQIRYHGRPAGFTEEPVEALNYVEAHDNETLFDNGIWKLPANTPVEVRARLQILANAFVALGQSPALFTAGTELLRSKSLDRDSYNSGDWFNAIDWSGTRSTFGTGLPPTLADHLEAQAAGRLNDSSLIPTKEAIAWTVNAFIDLLKLRRSTPLFTLGDADLISQKASFPAAAADTPGTVLFLIDDQLGPRRVDPNHAAVLVVFNPSPALFHAEIPSLVGRRFSLSPIQKAGSDQVIQTSTWEAATGRVSVPAFSAAVFLEPAPQPPAPGTV